VPGDSVPRVPFQVIPRELAFYGLFDRAADGVVAGAHELSALVRDLAAAPTHAERIQDLEHAGDDLTHEIVATLNTTFVTPFDRPDIHRLASLLDDVLDAQEAVADLLVLHGIVAPIDQFREQVDVMVRATEAVRVAVRSLRSFRGTEAACAEVRRLEREADWVYRRAVASLYSGDYRAMEVLIWKDLLHQIEGAVDRCEDIANTIDATRLKHA
jgi:predicted phosphate transport protein (TIGR00153 family)